MNPDRIVIEGDAHDALTVEMVPGTQGAPLVTLSTYSAIWHGELLHEDNKVGEVDVPAAELVAAILNLVRPSDFTPPSRPRRHLSVAGEAS